VYVLPKAPSGSMKNTSHPNISVHASTHSKSAQEREALLSNLRFGSVFTDHMVTIRWVDGVWQKGELTAYGPLSLSPATSTLHYGQAIFEGLKAYRHSDGKIVTFRPEMNARRFAASARRLAMPELPEERFIEAIDALVQQDRAWVPSAPGTSLYLRPLMFATEASLGVKPANEYLMILFASPVGAYFASGSAPVKLWVTRDHVRAAPHGTGSAKCAGNYAASLLAQAQAKEEGCDQVLYLDAIERKNIEELGGMNFFAVLRSGDKVTLVTPDLTSGTLLAGVTRDSILRIAKDMGYHIEVRPISLDELRATSADGTLQEAFACGTAAVVTAIGSITGEFGSIKLNEKASGPVTDSLFQELYGIQAGTKPDRYGWLRQIC
jgi:branched-chain amino acid aminotransferase